MFSERELRRVAAKIGLGVGQTEHEYVQLCVLDMVGKTEMLADTFYLKGGTALRLIYFSDWRHSVDLDFSAAPAFPADRLRYFVEEWFNQVELTHGIEVKLVDFHRVNGAARMRARFMGPLNHPARLLFDITLDELVLLPAQRKDVCITPFPNLQPTVLTYALEEILAEKMRSILQRGKARDYYDVWRLLAEKRNALDLAITRSILDQKCRHRGLGTPEVQSFLSPQRLAEAEIYWKRDLVEQVAMSPLPKWTVVTKELKGLLTDFFST